MSWTLRTAIEAEQTTVDFDGVDDLSAGDVLAVGSEYLHVRSAFWATVQPGETRYQRTSVDRGIQGTAEAAHDAGAAASQVTPSQGGAGVVQSVTIDLSAADIAENSVDVIPAQGLGTAIIPVAGSFAFTGGTQPFAGGTPVALRQDTTLLQSDTVPFTSTGDRLALIGSLPFPAIEALGDADNQPLVCEIGAGYTGSIAAATLVDGGSGYAVNDTITLIGDATPAEVVVDSVDGGGAVLTFHLTAGGESYKAGATLTQQTTSGSGVDFTVSVNTLTPLSDGTGRLTVLYYVKQLAA